MIVKVFVSLSMIFTGAKSIATILDSLLVLRSKSKSERNKFGVIVKKTKTIYHRKEKGPFSFLRYFLVLGFLCLISFFLFPLCSTMRKILVNYINSKTKGNIISFNGRGLNHNHSLHYKDSIFFYVSSLSLEKDSSFSLPDINRCKASNLNDVFRIQRSSKNKNVRLLLPQVFMDNRNKKIQNIQQYPRFNKRTRSPCFLYTSTSFLRAIYHKERNVNIKNIHSVSLFKHKDGKTKKRSIRSSFSSSIFCSGSTDPLRIIFLGTPDVAASSLKYLFDTSESSSVATDKDDKVNSLNPIYEIVGVVSQPPAPVGRKRILTNSPVHDLVLKLNENKTKSSLQQGYKNGNDIPIFTPIKANEADFLESLANLKPDICITAAYGNFLPTKFLKIPKLGTINIHPSLLPKYRGASPVQRCLENGDQVTGVSILYTVLKMDAGPIIFQTNRPLSGDEKTSILLPELFGDGARILADIVLPQLYEAKQKLYAKEENSQRDEIKEKIDLTDEERFSLLSNVREQDESLVSHADKMTKEEGLCLFSEETAETIHNKVRAFDIWPGTWGVFEIYQTMNDQQLLELEDKQNENNDYSRGNEKIEDTKRVKLITTKIIHKNDSSPNSLYTMLKPYLQKDEETGLCNSSLFLIENEMNKKQKHLIVRCADETFLELVEVQLEGKKPMQGKDWWNGLRGKKVRYTK